MKRLATALGGDEGVEVGERPRVEDVSRLDPPAARRPHTEAHLPVEDSGADELVRKQDFGPAMLRNLWAKHGATR